LKNDDKISESYGLTESIRTILPKLTLN